MAIIGNSAWADAAAVSGLVATTFMAGLLWVFSSSVMPALRDIAPDAGLHAMAKINRDIIEPIFGLAFGAGLLAAGLAIITGTADLGERWLLALAGALHLVGFLLVTATIHLPLNNRFENLDPTSAEDLATWTSGAARWTRFNHVRATATLAAASAYAIHLYLQLG